LVEDNPGDVALIREALAENDIQAEIILLDDGEKAYRYFQALDQNQGVCPDLVLLDLNLPKMSGWEVLEFVRRSSKCRHVSVAVLSSSDAAIDKLQAERLGANRYIRKPSDLEDFIHIGAIIRAVLSEGPRT
jgi:DNA-binding response OmpR family regulator